MSRVPSRAPYLPRLALNICLIFHQHQVLKLFCVWEAQRGWKGERGTMRESHCLGAVLVGLYTGEVTLMNRLRFLKLKYRLTHMYSWPSRCWGRLTWQTTSGWRDSVWLTVLRLQSPVVGEWEQFYGSQVGGRRSHCSCSYEAERWVLEFFCLLSPCRLAWKVAPMFRLDPPSSENAFREMPWAVFFRWSQTLSSWQIF